MMKKIAALLLALALLTCAGLAEQAEPQQAPAEDVKGSEDLESGEDIEGGSGDAIPDVAPGYVLVSTATHAGWLPLPKEEEYTFPLTQTLSDGTQATNLIHLTPEGVYMEDATCENHDCVQQGTVTFQNRDERILGNMIICLPNQVCLQLYTPEETLEMVTQANQNDK